MNACFVHKGVRESHFTSVDDAISYTFNECEDVVVLWVEDNFFEGCLFSVSASSFTNIASCDGLPRALVTSPCLFVCCGFGRKLQV